MDTAIDLRQNGLKHKRKREQLRQIAIARFRVQSQFIARLFACILLALGNLYLL